MQDGIYPSIRALMGAIQDARQTKDVEALEEEIQRLKDAIDFWSEGLEEGSDTALEKAPCHGGWEAWAKALKEQEIDAIPKGTQDDPGKLRGMYFEKEGVRLPGSSVGREYSFGNLERRLGVYEQERDSAAFTRVHIPGVGDRAMPSRMEQAHEKAPAVVQTPSPEASRSRAPEHGARSVQKPQTTPEERKERMVNDMRHALENATVDQGWKAWSRSLREQGVEAIPKGTQDEPGKLRGMYFERRGVRVPGSEVGRAYSFGNLEKTLGGYDQARDLSSFRRVHVPGVGDLATHRVRPQAQPAQHEQADRRVQQTQKHTRVPSPEQVVRAAQHSMDRTADEELVRRLHLPSRAASPGRCSKGSKAWRSCA